MMGVPELQEVMAVVLMVFCSITGREPWEQTMPSLWPETTFPEITGLENCWHRFGKPPPVIRFPWIGWPPFT